MDLNLSACFVTCKMGVLIGLFPKCFEVWGGVKNPDIVKPFSCQLVLSLLLMLRVNVGEMTRKTGFPVHE